MPTADSKRHWYRFTPDRFVVSLLLVMGLLWLSDRFQWFGFDHHKGWAVLIAVAAVGVAALVMLLWWAVALIFARRFQFGIRSVLVFCLACSIAAGWLAVEIKRARWQAEKVKAIESSGGSTFCDWQVDADDNPISNARSPGPGWLRNLVGVDFFSSVVVVIYGTKITDTGPEQLKSLTQLRKLYLSATNNTDAGLEHLKELTQLEVLYLSGFITDAGLEHLTKLTQLRQLDLSGTNITGAGLERLKELKHLQVLGLYGTKITDTGLEQLINGLPQLKGLSVAGTQVTDAGLVHLDSLTHLTMLDLSDTHITDVGLKQLQGLTHLIGLDLGGTQITDAGLEQLNGLSELHVLNLNRTQVTDAGLKHLECLTQLHELWLIGTEVTEADFVKFRHALPNCSIDPSKSHVWFWPSQ